MPSSLLAIHRPFALGLLCLLASSQTGCISLTSFLRSDSPTLDTKMLEAQGYVIPHGGMPMEVAKGDSTKPHVVMEVRLANEKRHVERIPIEADKAVFIQDLVQQAQLHKKIGALHISIMRPTDGGPPVHLPLSTDSDGKATSMATNYAVYPGDHLIVVEDNESAVEKLIRGQLGI